MNPLMLTACTRNSHHVRALAMFASCACWVVTVREGEMPPSNYGRLSGNPMGDKTEDSLVWGPPNSVMNWLPVIEYKQNVSGKNIYQPTKYTAINRWDKFEGKNRTYLDLTTEITDCNACYNATAYENAKKNFNSSAEYNSRWCHAFLINELITGGTGYGY